MIVNKYKYQLYFTCFRPIPLLTTVLIFAQADEVDNRKISLSASMKSVDGTVFYSSAKALFIDVTKSKL